LVGGAGALAGAAALGRTSRRASAQEQITLNVYVHDNHPFDRVKPIYEAMYPNVTLNMMKQSDIAVFRATLAAGGEGTPDIIWPSEEYVQDLGRSGVLMDTTDIVTELEDVLSPGARAACFIASTGKYAGFPGDVATIGIYYRQDLLEQAGVAIPETWTWDDYAAMAQEVKAQTGASALMLPSNGIPESMYLWSYILNQLGGGITSVDGTQVTFDDERGIAAMEQVKRLYEADIAIDESQFSETFFAEISAGNLAMCPLQVWYRNFGIEPNVFDEQSGLGQWRIALLPSAGEGSALSVNEGGAAIVSTIYTKHPEEVKNFMKLTHGTMEGAAATGDWGILPPYLPYLESPEWTGVRSPAFGDFAFNEIWSQAMHVIPTTWRRHAVFGEAEAAIGAAIMPMLEGSVDITEGLKSVGDQVRQLNERYQQ
jgi:ABC-type glycerol-3-phosphate transport system substrate-binding protein